MPERPSPPPPPPQRRPVIAPQREPSTLDQIKYFASDASEQVRALREDIEALRAGVSRAIEEAGSAARRASRIEDALPELGRLVVQSGPSDSPYRGSYVPPPIRRPLDTQRQLPGPDDSQRIELPAFPPEALQKAVQKTLDNNELSSWRKRRDAWMGVLKGALIAAGAVGIERLVAVILAHY